MVRSQAHTHEESLLIRDLWSGLPPGSDRDALSPHRGPAFIILQLASSTSCFRAFQSQTSYRIFMFSLKSPANAWQSPKRDPKGWGIRNRDALRMGETQ